MAKPSLFIGSSTEGLEFARAARLLLHQDAEVTLWNEGFFQLGSTFIETLVNSLPRFDFAILVLTPDDMVTSRDTESFSPRDNVLFELGLFMGRLGRTRTFILQQAGSQMKIPSDLSGVSTATYDWPRGDKNHQSAVAPACDRIRQVIRDLGVSEAKVATAIVDIQSRQERQEGWLSRQQAEIRWLKVALQGIVTEYEYEKLVGLNGDQPFLCYYSDDMVEELKRLRAMKLIQHQAGTGITVLRDRYKNRNARFDLKEFFYITERGQEYLQLRQDALTE